MSRAGRRKRPGELRGGLAWSRVGRGCGSLPLSSAGASGQEWVLSVPLDLACGESGEDAQTFPLQSRLRISNQTSPSQGDLQTS